jgi:hypothetical protein
MTQRTIHEELLTRRDAILRIGALMGGTAFVGQSALLAGCAVGSGSRRSRGGPLFSESEIAYLDEVADTILPDTDTPGAKAAGVGPFMALMVTDTYDDDDLEILRAGLETLEDECLAMHGVGFMAATPAQRLALLGRIDAEQYQYMRSSSPRRPTHYFRMIKELALLGYFTSEIGYTQAMRYIEAPGRFDPCVAYSPGDRAWAPHA